MASRIAPASQFYEFGTFRMDTVDRVLLRDQELVSLTPKVFDILVMLVENSGHVVEKDKLMKAIWPDSFVEEGNLTQNVFVLRKALGSPDNGHQYIQTVARRGYRFVGKVTSAVGDGTARIVDQSSTLHLVVRQQEPARSIAVLPFRIFSADQVDEYLGLGMADALITRLSRINRVIVRPTSSILKYDRSRQDAAEAGSELGVDNVLEGCFRKVGGRLRVTVQLVNVRDGSILWADRFDGNVTDIFAVEDSISEQVAAALTLTLTEEERQLLTKRHTRSNAAYHAYLKGRYYWNNRTADGLKQGMHYFREALREDPMYAQAYSGLADSYIVLGNLAYLPPKEAFLKAKEAATRALEIDPGLAEAHTSLGYVNWSFDWNWTAAEQEYRKAISLNSGYGIAHQWYGLFLASSGRADEAIDESERAQETDPLSPIVSALGGMVFYLCRQYDKAIEQCQKTLELDPAFYLARVYLGWAYGQKGMHDEAIAELQQSVSLSGGGLMPLTSLGCSYATSGQRHEAQKVIEQLSELSKQIYVPALYPAAVYASLGQKDNAFKAMDRAYEERSNWLTLLKVDPKVDSLRADPRFTDLMQRVGLAA